MQNLKELTKLNLDNFITSNVKSMTNMFLFCDELKEISMQNFDTSKVTDMSNMFRYAGYYSSLKVDPNVSGWNVNSVTIFSNFNTNATWITPPTWVN